MLSQSIKSAGVTVGLDGSGYAAFERPAAGKTEVGNGIADTARPVALTHDFKLVAVQSRWFESEHAEIGRAHV